MSTSLPKATDPHLRVAYALFAIIGLLAFAAVVAVIQAPSWALEVLNTPPIRVFLFCNALFILLLVAFQIYRLFHLPRARRLIIKILMVIVGWGTIHTMTPFGLSAVQTAALDAQVKIGEIVAADAKARASSAWNDAVEQSPAIYVATLIALCLLVCLYILVGVIESKEKIEV